MFPKQSVTSRTSQSKSFAIYIQMENMSPITLKALSNPLLSHCGGENSKIVVNIK